MRFGLLPFRSPLLRKSLLISFPGLLRWFTSPGLTPQDYFIHPSRYMPRGMRVTPFGHPRLTGYVLLPAASRSLSRPSSPSVSFRHPPTTFFSLAISSFPSSAKKTETILRLFLHHNFRCVFLLPFSSVSQRTHKQKPNPFPLDFLWRIGGSNP